MLTACTLIASLVVALVVSEQRTAALRERLAFLEARRLDHECELAEHGGRIFAVEQGARPLRPAELRAIAADAAAGGGDPTELFHRELA